MLGSYGPHPQGEAYTKNFDPEEAPTGMLARSTYSVRSRLVDDDGEIYAGTYRYYCPSSLSLNADSRSMLDFDWAFKIAKDW